MIARIASSTRMPKIFHTPCNLMTGSLISYARGRDAALIGNPANPPTCLAICLEYAELINSCAM